MDGYPVAERAIREHSWIDAFSDSDESISMEEEVRSTASINIGAWISKVATARSSSDSTQNITRQHSAEYILLCTKTREKGTLYSP